MQENLPVSRASDHLYILATILFTVYSQLAMRWQVGVAGEVPTDAIGKARFIATLLMNPWVLSGILATFLAGVSWMLTMTRFELGYAYPFVGLNYVLVLAASVLLFHESLSGSKILGTVLVIAGVVVISRG
jgi:multidrug transporter EmrE-like cation transporter